jgi:hypothetical protein
MFQMRSRFLWIDAAIVFGAGARIASKELRGR